MADPEPRISIHIEYREIGSGVSEVDVELEGPSATTANLDVALRNLLTAKTAPAEPVYPLNPDPDPETGR